MEIDGIVCKIATDIQPITESINCHSNCIIVLLHASSSIPKPSLVPRPVSGLGMRLPQAMQQVMKITIVWEKLMCSVKNLN